MFDIKWIRENPDAWVAHYLATALAKEGEVQKALSWLRRARDLGWELSEEERDRLELRWNERLPPSSPSRTSRPLDSL